jgi:hypothetical protein
VAHNVTLISTSLLSILFMTFHLADDIVRGIEPGGMSTLTGVLILAAWLYGTLVLAGRRSGYVVVLLFSILGRVFLSSTWQERDSWAAGSQTPPEFSSGSGR